MGSSLSPEKLFNVGLGFWAAKVLLAAVKMGLFTELAKGPLAAEALRQRLGLHPRSHLDFFDALVSMQFLERENGVYRNSAETDWFLDRNKPSYMGGLFEMSEDRLYGAWGNFCEALKTGLPQNDSQGGEELFKVLYSTPERLKSFLQAMTGLSLETGRAIARHFPFEKYRVFFDVGAAQGGVPVEIALAHPHLSGGGFDLPPVQPIFEEYVRAKSLQDRLRFIPGNFMEDSLPEGDVLIMGHILHDWNLEEKKMLLSKAFNALPRGGAVIIHEALIDDDRRQNTFGLLMSLNMLIETPGGFDYSGADCCQWMREVGFRETRVEALPGPDSMVIGVK